MPSLSSRFPMRLSTIALTLVFVSVLVGLWFADQTLRESERGRAHADAEATAALVEGFLAVHAEALSAFRGLYAAENGKIDGEQFKTLVAALGERLQGFRRIWLTDSSGVVVQAMVLRNGLSAMPPGLDVDTLHFLGTNESAQRARATKKTQASRPDTVAAGDRGFQLLEPIHFRGEFAGFAMGTISLATLRQTIMRRPASERTEIVVLAGTDTIAQVGTHPRGQNAPLAHAAARLPDGREWQVDVYHATTDVAVRLWVWVVAVAAFVALVFAVGYERAQARRIAERSHELEHLSAELLRANRAKSEFLANVSHELRTPLNAIVGFVDLLRDGVYGELKPRQVAPVERIEASANHLRHLVDQVLDLAKMAAGRLEVHTEIIDLRPFVLNVASEVESLVSEKGLNLSLSVGASLPRVRTDPTHLRQILVNLLGNAVKFTPSGTIAVRTRLVGVGIGGDGDDARGGRFRRPPVTDALRARAPRADAIWIALQVADTGIGISEQDRERIFDEFEQVNAGPRGDSMRRGTGLGLSISRRLARLLGGDISVESEPGKGSVFTVWLPVDPMDIRGEGRGVRGDSAPLTPNPSSLTPSA